MTKHERLPEKLTASQTHPDWNGGELWDETGIVARCTGHPEVRAAVAHEIERRYNLHTELVEALAAALETNQHSGQCAQLRTGGLKALADRKSCNCWIASARSILPAPKEGA